MKNTFSLHCMGFCHQNDLKCGSVHLLLFIHLLEIGWVWRSFLDKLLIFITQLSYCYWSKISAKTSAGGHVHKNSFCVSLGLYSIIFLLFKLIATINVAYFATDATLQSHKECCPSAVQQMFQNEWICEQQFDWIKHRSDRKAGTDALFSSFLPTFANLSGSPCDGGLVKAIVSTHQDVSRGCQAHRWPNTDGKVFGGDVCP